MRLNRKWTAFSAFTAVFAALVAFVFWGTWSLDFAPVMPDDGTVHSMVYGDYVRQLLRNFISSGKLIPTDVLWEGLLFSKYFCQELKYAVALYFAGLGLAFLLRGRGLSRLASYGAGLLLSFCGYWATLFSAGHGGWFIWMTYGVFAFGLVDRVVRLNIPVHGMLLGALTAWGSFCQPDLWLLFTCYTGLYLVWCCLRERRFPLKSLAVAALFFFVIGAPSFYTALFRSLKGRDAQIEEGQTIVAKEGTSADEKRWIFITNWSLPFDETAEFLVPRLNGDTSCPLTLSIGLCSGSGVRQYTGALGRANGAKEGNYRQHSLYVGFITCLLALVGALTVSRRYRKTPSADGECRRFPDVDVYFFIGAAVLFWLFSLGRNCEAVYRCVYALPFGDYLRAPVKWHHLTEFSLCALAGYGIECLLRMPWLKGRRGFAIVAAVVLIGAVDLAWHDHLYCAPVNLREVRLRNAEMQMTVLRRSDFSNPNVQAMVKSGQIVSLAYYLGNPEYYLVEMLNPRKPDTAPMPPFTLATALGILSQVGALGLVVSLVCMLRGRKS